MKKIGILTHYYHSRNLGGLLQAYALTTSLRSAGIQAEQIAFDFNFFDFRAKKIRKKIYPRKNIFKRIVDKLSLYLHNFLNKRELPLVLKLPPSSYKFQDIACEKFEQFIPHSSTRYNNSNIQQANKEYSTFITGSDQVFASYLLPLGAFYGEFATSDKKIISYAASSDVREFPPKAEALFIQKLQRLNAISVREKTLKNYIERITDKKAVVLLDSTFLLSAQEWLGVAAPASKPQKPYIFCYFLGETSTWQRRKAQEYADKYDYEVVHLPYIMQTARLADKYLKGQG
ncbi:MAG: polysaccharide pyruvyl transferase family protein, partial [Elusimicrobiaceae bacterium]|nr:polysaccharide pyruvyl transferase family protein [Elusimicrobiaceae bacterium]